jgi:nucleoside-diphosphate-sugar epimerase
MKIGIVGGTSQVATELAVLFRDGGHEVHPTVRSQVGASFYEHHGLDYRIVDLTDPAEARQGLADVDVVVIAAFARQYARGFNPNRARRINERLVRSAVRHARADATLVYFSTIAIYGDEVGLGNWDSYARGKRAAEKAFLDACEGADATGYSLRMGPVYGANQDKAQSLRARIEDCRTPTGQLHVACDPARPSNVLHTVTLADAVQHCHRDRPEGDVYSLVDHPAWTWREVVEHYAPADTTVRFHGTSGDPSLADRVLQYGKEFVESRERALRSFTPYLPRRLNQRIFNEYVKRRVASDVGALETAERLHLSQFEQEPAPGPFLPGLEDTRSLLERVESVRDYFEADVRT